MNKHILSTAIFFLFLNTPTFYSQSTADKPKLVVGIVVDQMRNDYMYRYWDRFGNGGFKRLANQGYYFRNAHFNYIPTFTGPGHCSIYTGATPCVHGIIANEWYSKKERTSTYCVQDSSVLTIGSTSKNGKMSPKNQLSSTIGDELKMSSNQRAKVFSIALKDRSAVLPAGHTANGAFWLDDATGDFISSSWYMNALPAWIKAFNEKKYSEAYLKEGWQTLYPTNTYSNSIADSNRYEGAPGKESPVFPYDFKKQLDKKSWGTIKAIPAGNSLTKDLALACLRAEQLGKGTESDLLCISFSATDYVAHAFGPRAIETEDTYLRLDKDLEDLLNTLDKEVGKGNYVVFLTADHGGADVPNHLIDEKIPAGYMHDKKLQKELRDLLKTNYGDSLLLLNMSNEQLFLNETRIAEKKLNQDEIEARLCSFLLTQPGVAEAYPSAVLKNRNSTRNDLLALLQNGYNHKLSGNVAIIYQPAWMDHGDKGTTHGAGYNYDTHVPVLFYGKGIPMGKNFNYVTITQIAPTVCELLHINQPNSTISQPLNIYFK